MRLTTSLFRWGKVLGLCCAGSTLAPESLVLRRTTSRRHQPSTCFLAPTGSIKPWFHTEGKLAAVRITTSSWGSQRTRAVRVSRLFSGAVAGDLKKSYTTKISISHVNCTPAANFWRRCRGDQDTLQGESPHRNLFYFVFVLLSFIYYFVYCTK